MILIQFSFTTVFSQQQDQDDQNDEITRSDIIELELIPGVQNPETLEFEYILRIRSLIDTNRLRVDWKLVNGYASVLPEYSLSDAVSINEGEELYITKKFRPINSGLETIRITAIAFGSRDDFVSSTSQEFLLNDELELNPTSENYQDFKQAQQLKQFLDIAKYILFTINILLFLLIIIWRFRMWLESD
jgi:hypothetical protein